MKLLFFRLLLYAGFFLCCPLSNSIAQGTAFTYQGGLWNAGIPANGNYDLRFELYATNIASVVIAGPVTNSATPVSNGTFSVLLDFGAGVFDGNNYWLEVAVQTNLGNGFTTLSPRQAITPTPYAIFASNANTALTAGTAQTVTTWPPALVTNGATSVNLTGTISGNGAGLTNLNLPASQNVISNGAINVKAPPWGAKGDGKSDDTAALQSCFDAVFTNGGNAAVYMPAGIYLTSATLRFPGGNTRLYGDGAATIIQIHAEDLDCLSFGLAGFPFKKGNNISVSDIAVDCSYGGRNGISFYGVTNGSISRCMVISPGLNNFVGGVPSGYGIWLFRLDDSITGPGHPTVGVTVSDCQVTNVVDTGIECSGALQCKVIGNAVENCLSGGGIYIWNGSSNCIVLGNTVTAPPKNANNGIVIDDWDNSLAEAYATNFPTVDNIIANNTISGSLNGINLPDLGGVSNNFVVQNIFVNTPHPLLSFSTDYNVFFENFCTGTRGWIRDTWPATAANTNVFLAGAGNPLNQGIGLNYASGFSAFSSDTTGSNNTATGLYALQDNTIGNFNTVSGFYAGHDNTIGSDNTFEGYTAGGHTTSGSDSTAIGNAALFGQSTGQQNTAIGSYSAHGTDTGWDNFAGGYNSLLANTGGDENVAIGYDALMNDTNSEGNIAIGAEAGVNATNNANDIYIGNPGVAGETGVVRIGTTNIHTNVVLSGNIVMPTNSPTPPAVAGSGILWNSNNVLYWVTPTHTNYVAGP